MNSLDIKKDRQKLQKQLEKECTFLCQSVVKKRAGGRCEVTGIKAILEHHHNQFQWNVEKLQEQKSKLEKELNAESN